MIEWHIQSRSHHCQRCNVTFRDKEPFHTLLSEERFGYARHDVCEGCWKANPATAETRAISHWQSIYSPPPSAPPEPIQKENAESLLRKLVELQNPAHLACCYILAAMLERKRMLKVKEQFKRDGQRVFLYEHPKTGDLFTIVDPGLQLNQLEQVQRDVALLLERGVAPGQPAPDEKPASSFDVTPLPEPAAQPPGNPPPPALIESIEPGGSHEGVAPLAATP